MVKVLGEHFQSRKELKEDVSQIIAQTKRNSNICSTMSTPDDGLIS